MWQRDNDRRRDDHDDQWGDDHDDQWGDYHDDQWGDDHDDIRSVKLGSDRGAAMQGVNKEKKERKWKVGNYLEKEN